MERKRLRALLDHVRGIGHACDLDLLVFFYRHPCALLTSELLVAYLGYDRDRIAKSLDGLIEVGLLRRSQHPAHAARLYRLEFNGQWGGQLKTLLEVASTRQGRMDVLQVLMGGPDAVTEATLLRRVGLVRVA